MPYQVCLLPGDGIGPEVIAQAEVVLQALGLDFSFSRCDIGYGAYQKWGTPLPEATLEAIRGADATLFGAVTTPPAIVGRLTDYFSPVVRMRQALDLYANLRPCRSFHHPSSRPGIDLVIVRENTEGLYSGVERLETDDVHGGGERAIGERIITRYASERIVRKAFELARQEGRQKVTVVHKANILRVTCGLFRQVAFEVAKSYPEIRLEEMLVDTCAMELVRAPEQFEIIVTTNLFGDILSDEACMLVGGLGLATSGNFGERTAIFEPVHGSAPGITGQHRANPAAAFLSAAMLLDYVGEPAHSARLRQAVAGCLRRNAVTPDLGGELSTEQMTEQVLTELEKGVGER
jgi:homoisocitrate dehydrogenase